MEKKQKRQKYRGTKGSNTQEQCKVRHELGVQIIQEHNYKITKKAFLTEYQQRISRSATLNEVTERTWDRDIPFIKAVLAEVHKVDFTFLPTAKTRKRKFVTPIPFYNPFELIEKNLYQIRIAVENYQDILFSLNNNTFVSRDFAFKSFEHIPQKYRDELYMFHLYLIFDFNAPHGIETTYCKVYEDAGKENGFFLLYTDAKNHCTEIVCTYNNLQQVLEYTYLLFNRYWRKKE